MKKNILLCAALAALTACNGNSDNNKSLDYETIDVNFTLKSDLEIPEGTEFGVVALCARDGQQGVNMGEKPVASFKVSGTASPQRLAASSEGDKIQARESDHGFSFYAVSPYKNNVDVSAMQVSLPARQNYSDGIIKYLPMLAVKNVVSVLPDVEFDVKTPFSVLNLSVPADIVEEGVPATLNFPEGGLKIQAAGAVLPVVVLLFENPAGGFDITFTDINGKQYTTSFLNQDSDAGNWIEKDFGANAVVRYDATLSDASDVDNGWLAEICVPRSSVKVVDGKVKVNLALFDMEGGEDAIVSTGEKNPQKWITVTGL